MKRQILIASTVFIGVPALSSSPSAWAALQARAERSCIEKSGLLSPRVSNPIVFADDVGTVALLVTGRVRVSRYAPISVTQLCLYDRLRETAVVEEALGWSERQSTGI